MRGGILPSGKRAHNSAVHQKRASAARAGDCGRYDLKDSESRTFAFEEPNHSGSHGAEYEEWLGEHDQQPAAPR